MTSSLVGSEMCIRDSSNYSAPLANNSFEDVCLAGLASRGTLVSHAPVAVSYTHLTLPTICSV
eukprot:1739148-Prorocentrum_lima.AAC.1